MSTQHTETSEILSKPFGLRAADHAFAIQCEDDAAKRGQLLLPDKCDAVGFLLPTNQAMRTFEAAKVALIESEAKDGYADGCNNSAAILLWYGSANEPSLVMAVDTSASGVAEECLCETMRTICSQDEVPHLPLHLSQLDFDPQKYTDPKWVVDEHEDERLPALLKRLSKPAAVAKPPRPR